MRQIGGDWWINVNDTYSSRNQEDCLVLWKGGRTIWLHVWPDTDPRSRRERLDEFIEVRDPAAIDLFRGDEDRVSRFGYLLEELEGGGIQFGLYSWTISETSVVRMACYYDLKEDLEWATEVTRSLAFGAPKLDLEEYDRLGESGYFALASERVIGHGRLPVLLARRESAARGEDSGWRFFRDDAERREDPDSVLAGFSFCPLTLFLNADPSLRGIINQPAGTTWKRADYTQPWSQIFPE